MSREEWQTVRFLADDRSILIKKTDKGSCVEAERQLSDTKVSRDVSNTENILSKLSETSNGMFISLKRIGFLTEKQMKYFTYEFKKATNFGKLYLLPKIHKRLHNVPGRPVISNCEVLQKSVQSFLTII